MSREDSVLRWLGKIGLGGVAHRFQELGITTPEALAELDIADFDLVGVNDERQRKNLFLLIEGVRQCMDGTPGEGEETLVDDESEDGSAGDSSSDATPPAPPPAVPATPENRRPTAPTPRRSARLAARAAKADSEEPISSSSSPSTSPAPSPSQRPWQNRRRTRVAEPPSMQPRGAAEAEADGRSTPQRVSKIPPPPRLSAASSDDLGATRDSTLSLSSTTSSLPPPPPPATTPPAFVESESFLRPPPALSPAAELSDASESDLDDDMQIRVIVRKRPLKASERALLPSPETENVENAQPSAPPPYDAVIHLPRGRPGVVEVREPKVRVDLTRCLERHSFRFDDAFDERDDTRAIHRRCLAPLLRRATRDGGNVTVFAYGQTGSGKTFTMLGNPNVHGMSPAGADWGLVALAAADIFRLCQSPPRSLTASFFEIYGSKLFDLLCERQELRALEDSGGGVHVRGLSEHPLETTADLMRLMDEGKGLRSTGETAANATSSRSHAVLHLNLRDPRRASAADAPLCRVTFIDLAGSERGADTAATDRTTRQEGAEINTSLLALKEVIRAIDKQQRHTPFRGSKLTQVLKDCFVGDTTRTLMVACVAPDRKNCEHSLNTLRYADRVKEKDAPAPTGPKENRKTGGRGGSNKRSSLGVGMGGRGEEVRNKGVARRSLDGLSAGAGRERGERAGMQSKARPSRPGKDGKANPLRHGAAPTAMPAVAPARKEKEPSANTRLEELVDGHRRVMQTLVDGVKDEMDMVYLVDRTEEGAGAIHEYLDVLETSLDDRQQLVEGLRGRLRAFQEARAVEMRPGL